MHRLLDPPVNPVVLLVAIALLKLAFLLFVLPAADSVFALRNIWGLNLWADNYNLISNNIVAGNGYRFMAETAETTLREPGYPLFLAFLFKIFGTTELWPAKIANVVLITLSSYVLYQIIVKFSGDKLAALFAALLLMGHPGIVIVESRGGFEALVIFLMLLMFATLLAAIRGRHLWLFALAGLLCGATTLTKGTFLLLPIFLGVWLAVVLRQELRTRFVAGGAALMMVVTLVTLSPWVIRNHSLTGEFIPTASVFGIAAHAGQYICENRSSGDGFANLDWQASQERKQQATVIGWPFEGNYYQFFYDTKHEVEFSKIMAGQVIQKYVDNPALFARCVTTNVANFWFAGKNITALMLNVGLQLPYLILAFAGVVLLWHRSKYALIALGVGLIGYYYGLHVLVHSQARYSMVLIPIVSLFAGHAVAALLRRMLPRLEARAS